jgi:hypothetical protein
MFISSRSDIGGDGTLSFEIVYIRNAGSQTISLLVGRAQNMFPLPFTWAPEMENR